MRVQSFKQSGPKLGTPRRNRRRRTPHAYRRIDQGRGHGKDARVLEWRGNLDACTWKAGTMSPPDMVQTSTCRPRRSGCARGSSSLSSIGLPTLLPSIEALVY